MAGARCRQGAPVLRADVEEGQGDALRICCCRPSRGIATKQECQQARALGPLDACGIPEVAALLGYDSDEFPWVVLEDGRGEEGKVVLRTYRFLSIFGANLGA